MRNPSCFEADFSLLCVKFSQPVVVL